MASKKYSKRHLPPCPDPEKYTLVKTEEGYYWRKKRGTIKKAKLNEAMHRQANTTKITGPAAGRILRKLLPYTQGFKKGGLNLVISGKLTKACHEKGKIDFSLLGGLELNKGYPLEKLFHGEYMVSAEAGLLCIRIKTNKGTVQPQNNLATDYYFEAILLYGDATQENKLRTEDTASPLYSFAQTPPVIIELTLQAPPNKYGWLLLLKVNCHEGNEMGGAPDALCDEGSNDGMI